MGFDKECRDGYFAAANTGKGFVSYFDEIFFGDDIKQRYIIKGGPGTGKSSFMRRAAERARSKGRRVQTYYCSSDTASLDGIIIDGSIAVFDGTAPHSYDARLPGACDEIINLGAFWNKEMLTGQGELLSVYARDKKSAYSNAYGYLRAAADIDATLRAVISECVMTEKMRAAVRRISEKSFGVCGDSPTLCHRQVEALGVHGKVRLSTLYELASRRYAVIDFYGVAGLYTRELVARALKCGQSVYVSDDVVTGIANEIYFPDTGDYVFVASAAEDVDESITKINMKRFADTAKISQSRRYYRAARQAYKTLVELAARELSVAGTIHADMERVYVASMDFDALRQYTDMLLDKII